MNDMSGSQALQESGVGAGPRLFNEVLLEVKQVSLSFGGVKALSDVSFDIKKGEVRAIIGPNGAGKSSMLNCINGFYHPQEGTITYKGKERRQMRPHEAAKTGIARTFQNIALFRGMSTLDNIMTGRLLKMKSNLFWQALYWGPNLKEENEHREKVEHIIDFLEIQDIRKTPVGRLPYGLQKRVELGRALAMEPELLLLDEPMAGMGQSESRAMMDLLRPLKGQIGILLVEHDMDVVFALADRVSVLVKGALLMTGTPQEVRDDPEVRRAYLGDGD